MKKLILFAAALIVSSIAVCYAQDDTIQNEIKRNEIKNKSIRLGGALMGIDRAPGWLMLHGHIYVPRVPAINMSADILHISNTLSMGVHLGFNEAWSRDQVELSAASEFQGIGVHYGIDFSYNLLENANIQSDKWDLRLNACVGSYWTLYSSNQLEYGLGVSATYYPFKHWGFYADWRWGRFLYNVLPYLTSGSTKMELGVSYRF